MLPRTRGMRSSCMKTCTDIFGPSSKKAPPQRISRLKRFKRRSAARKFGPPALPTTAAAMRAWPSQKTRVVAIFMIASTLPSAPNSFSRRWRAAWPAVGGQVRIRSDAKWSVPEPELTLVVNPRGQIIGYTVGNDMSSRDIEGENPLYLPQAKVYDLSCALGPCILVSSEPLPATTPIRIEIVRAGRTEFSGATSLAELKRDPKTLVEYLFRDNHFPAGAYLMTGTGIVPPDSFTLASGDTIRITIDPIGTLENVVLQG